MSLQFGCATSHYLIKLPVVSNVPHHKIAFTLTFIQL